MDEQSALPLEIDRDSKKQDTLDENNLETDKPGISGNQEDSSSDPNHHFEHGRRYHSYKGGSYLLPNDVSEQNRLDFQHKLFRFALDGHLFLAPLPNDKVHDVLDVGCGTGKWCSDVAEEIPHAQVVGFDLSAIQPADGPSNCKFFVEDCNADWNTFNIQQFDLIHTRAITPAIKDWPRYLKQAYNQLKPGGYIELHEIHIPARYIAKENDPTVPHFVQIWEGVIEGGAKIGLDFSVSERLEGLLNDTGFVHVTVQWHKWPVGAWAKGEKNKKIGRAWAEDLKIVSRGFTTLFTKLLGWPVERFEALADNVRDEIDSGERHLWIDMCFAYARKSQTQP